MVKIVKEFRYRFEEALSIRGMRAIDITNKTGISEATISQYKSGYSKPKDDRVALIADVLDVNPAWLMGFDCPMECDSASQFNLSPVEKEIILAYRKASPDMQAGLCAFLGIKGDTGLLRDRSIEG